jgi:hypothetical protein
VKPHDISDELLYHALHGDIGKNIETAISADYFKQQREFGLSRCLTSNQQLCMYINSCVCISRCLTSNQQLCMYLGRFVSDRFSRVSARAADRGASGLNVLKVRDLVTKDNPKLGVTFCLGQQTQITLYTKYEVEYNHNGAGPPGPS